MSDQATPVTGLTIPEETQMKFTEMVELICGSESMNIEEKQYWINILPVMSEDQLTNLKDILMGEKEQLKAIDEKYAVQISTLGTASSLEEIGTKMKTQKEERIKIETDAEAEEREREAALLSEIDSL
jgi:hypothetical protein